MSPELITSLSAMLIGILGAITSLFLALRKRISDEDIPALKQRIADLEQLRKTDRAEYERGLAVVEVARERDRAEYQREVNECRTEVLALDRRYYGLHRFVVGQGVEVPEELQRPVRWRQPPAAGGPA